MKASIWSGDVDVQTRGGAFVARVYLPGAPLDAVHVEISDDELTVNYGKFFRRIDLPAGAWLNKASIAIAGGLLEIRVPVALDEATELGVPVPLPVFGLTAA